MQLSAPLSDLQVEIIDIFVHLLQVIGLPKSTGEIYGFLFASEVPVTFDDLVAKLNISSGSASQGLKLLRSVGAVKTTYVAGDRRDHYFAETCLGKLAAGFLRDTIQRHFSYGEERLARLEDLLSSVHGTGNPARHVLEDRVNALRVLHDQAKTALPAAIQTFA